jgi:hypothetical protein
MLKARIEVYAFFSERVLVNVISCSVMCCELLVSLPNTTVEPALLSIEQTRSGESVIRWGHSSITEGAL